MNGLSSLDFVYAMLVSVRRGILGILGESMIPKGGQITIKSKKYLHIKLTNSVIEAIKLSSIEHLVIV